MDVSGSNGELHSQRDLMLFCGKKFSLSTEDIEDLQQDTFLKSYTRYGKWLSNNSLISKIFNNLIIDKFLRKKKIFVDSEFDEELVDNNNDTPYSEYPFTEDIIDTKNTAEITVYSAELQQSVKLFLEYIPMKIPLSKTKREIILTVWLSLIMRPQIIYEDRSKKIKITDLLHYCKKEGLYDYTEDYSSLFSARNAIAKVIELYRSFMHPYKNDGNNDINYCNVCIERKNFTYLYRKLTD